MTILANTKVAEMMSAYLALIKSDHYKKIEVFVEENGGANCAGIPVAAELVRLVRGFVTFSLDGIDPTYNMMNWYAKNDIANLAIDVAKGEITKPTGTEDILHKWERFVGKEIPIANAATLKSSPEVELWFFSNAAKSFKSIRDRLFTIATDDDKASSGSEGRKLTDRELTGTLRTDAKALLNSMSYLTGASTSAMSRGGASVALMKNLQKSIVALYPATFSKSSYQVLKFTRFAGSWTKDASVSNLEQLKNDINAPMSQEDASGGLLTSLYLEALGSGFKDVESQLAERVKVQMNVMSKDAFFPKGSLNGYVPLLVKTDAKGNTSYETSATAPKSTDTVTNVVKELRLLAITKTMLFEYNRNVMKPLIEWQKNAVIAKASAAVANATLSSAVSIVGGVIGLVSEDTRELFDRISQSQNALFEASSSLPVTIGSARIEFLQQDLKRLIDLVDALMGNYNMLMEIQNTSNP